MDKSKLSPEEILEFCDVIDSDDGISPQELEKRQRKQQSNQHSSRCRYRLAQLCRQVLHGIDDAIWCDCSDPQLRDLRAIDVRPASGSSALVATMITPETDLDKIALIHERLMASRGTIRASIGGVISRKRVPQIQFRVIPEKVK